MKSAKGKNVLVTGAAMGMGRLFAERAIAEEAAAVVLWDIDESALNDTLNDLDDGPCEVSGYIVDVSDIDAVADTAAAVLDDLGRIDVLVNNAGVVRRQPLLLGNRPRTRCQVHDRRQHPGPDVRRPRVSPGDDLRSGRMPDPQPGVGSRLHAQPADGGVRRLEVGGHRVVGFGPPRAQAGRTRPRQGDDRVPVLRGDRHVRRCEVGAAPADPRP